MEERYPCRTRWSGICVEAGTYLFLFGMTALLQYGNGAFSSEFGNHPDEAAHYVTGLMVHDYLWSGDWLQPRVFAEEYYIHYPKVALGHWPPFFYLLQTAWMSVFPNGRISLVLFMAVLTASLAMAVYREGRFRYGWWAGLGLGVLLLLLPPVQHGSVALMADVLMALLCLQATRAFGRFLDYNRWQDACAFGLWSSLAILTKGTGLALALVPLFALVLSRRFHLLLRWQFWLPAVLVATCCAPWYYVTLGMVQQGWFESQLSWEYSLNAVSYYMKGAVGSLGAGLFALAALGLFTSLIRPAWRGEATGRWSSFGAWLLGYFLFQCVVPCGVEERFLLPVLPVLVIAGAAGADQAVRFLTARMARPRRWLVCPVLVSVFFFAFVDPLPKALAVSGYSQVAREVLRDGDERSLVFLVSSDSSGEGMFISEIAQRDRRHAHVVLRTSKVLSSSHWVGKDYALRFPTVEECAAYLDQLSVDFIILEMTVPPQMQLPDQRQLLAYLESASPHYNLAGKFPLVRGDKVYPNGIHVYRLHSTGSSSPRMIRVPMDAMLGRTLELALP